MNDIITYILSLLNLGGTPTTASAVAGIKKGLAKLEQVESAQLAVAESASAEYLRQVDIYQDAMEEARKAIRVRTKLADLIEA